MPLLNDEVSNQGPGIRHRKLDFHMCDFNFFLMCFFLVNLNLPEAGCPLCLLLYHPAASWEDTCGLIGRKRRKYLFSIGLKKTAGDVDTLRHSCMSSLNCIGVVFLFGAVLCVFVA